MTSEEYNKLKVGSIIKCCYDSEPQIGIVLKIKHSSVHVFWDKDMYVSHESDYDLFEDHMTLELL